MIKNIIAGFMSFGLCLSFLNSIRVESAVIEPEIVKTETWTASYSVGDSVYPYIEMTAYIFNDGYIQIVGNNTHEFTGFRTFTETVRMNYSIPYSTDSEVFLFSKGLTFSPHSTEYTCDQDPNFFSQVDISYVPTEYSLYGDQNHKINELQKSYNTWMSNSAILSYQYYETKHPNGSRNTSSVYAEAFHGYLCDIQTGIVISHAFCPKSYIKNEVTFHLYGHDITITPELLSGNIVAQPELTEQEKYIKQLEEENAKLKTENEQYREIINTNKDEIIKNLESEKEMLEDTLYQYKLIDYNGNGKLDVDDSQMILMYYVNTLAGKYTGTIEDYVVYRNDKAYESVHISGGI